MKKKISMLIIAMVLINSLGIAFAADNVKLNGMDSDKAIGYQGVMNLTNQTSNTSINGLCTDKYTTIYIGDVVPATSGTTGITNASKVKTLIIQNYRPDMTAQEGYDLQGAIWFFTNGITPENPAQQSMVDAAIADTTEYPDIYSLFLSNSTILISNTTNSKTEQIGTETTAVLNGITLGNTTTVKTEIIRNTTCFWCEKITTTVTVFYEKIATFTTVDYFKTTTTTIEIFETTSNYLDFMFNSVQQPNKQELILFTADARSTVEKWNNTIIQEEYFDNSTTWNETYLYNTTNSNEVINCHKKNCTIDPVKNKTNETVPGTIPMQNTGIQVLTLLMAVMGILAGLVIANRK